MNSLAGVFFPQFLLGVFLLRDVRTLKKLLREYQNTKNRERVYFCSHT